jgi:hypothetical protein
VVRSPKKNRNTRKTTLQVRKLWEALLASQPEMQAGEGAARLQALVQARLVGNVTSTKRVAEDKRVYELEGGFIMTKVGLIPTVRTTIACQHICWIIAFLMKRVAMDKCVCILRAASP